MSRSIVIIFLILSGISSQANAESGDQYWMAKAGLSWLNKSDKPDTLKALNLTYGYGVTEGIAVELDYQQSAGGGSYSTVSGTTTEKGAYSYKLGSIGAAYRYVFYESLYFRGKLALAYGENRRTSNLIKTDYSEVANLTGSLALGILAGDIVGSSFTVELEYRQQSESLKSALLGFNLTF